jgi:hypothetical protein
MPSPVVDIVPFEGEQTFAKGSAQIVMSCGSDLNASRQASPSATQASNAGTRPSARPAAVRGQDPEAEHHLVAL